MSAQKKWMVAFSLLTLWTCFAWATESPANNEAEQHYQNCVTELKNGNYDKAIEYGNKAVTLIPDRAEYHFMLANAYGLKAQNAGLLKKFGAAKSYKAEIENALKLDPNHLDARFGLIQFYLHAPGIIGGSRKKAEEHVAIIAKINPLFGHYANAELYTYDKNTAKAEEEFLQATQINVQNIDPYFRLGTFYIQTEKFEKAADVYAKILTLDANSALAHYYIGRVAVGTGQDLQKGLESLQIYMHNKPKENEPTIADAYWRSGNIYEKMGQPGQALAAYSKALELNPTHKRAKTDWENCKKKTH